MKVSPSNNLVMNLLRKRSNSVKESNSSRVEDHAMAPVVTDRSSLSSQRGSDTDSCASSEDLDNHDQQHQHFRNGSSSLRGLLALHRHNSKRSNNSSSSISKRKRVTFNDKATRVHQCTVVIDEETYWYNRAELKKMRDVNSYVSMTIFKDEHGQDNSYYSVLESVFEALRQQPNLSGVQEDRLRNMCHRCYTRVGLDRYVLRSMASHGQTTRQQLVTTVTRHYRSCKGLLRRKNPQQLQQAAEQLRLECERLSRPSRHYAVYMGRAQPLLLQEE